PDLVGVKAPDLVAGIEGDGEGDLEPSDRLLDDGRVLSEVELRRVDADDVQSRGGVAAMPFLNVRKGADGVERAAVPEPHERNATPQQRAGPDECRVQPGGRGRERGYRYV